MIKKTILKIIPPEADHENVKNEIIDFNMAQTQPSNFYPPTLLYRLILRQIITFFIIAKFSDQY